METQEIFADIISVSMVLFFFLIALVVLILTILYFSHRKIVMENSNLYKNIQSINKKYTFYYNIENVLNLKQECNSKKSFDNFDFSKNLQRKIAENLKYYRDLYDKLCNNSKLWKEYSKEYKSIENYATQENIKNVYLPLRIFNWHEKLLYKKSIQKRPPTFVSIKFIISYTSPAGRNEYTAEANFSYKEFISLLNEVMNEIIEKELKEKKRIEKEELYNKVRKITNIEQRESKLVEKEALYGSIEKREKKLRKREEDLLQREEEFLAATSDHIYAKQNVNSTNEEEEFNIQPVTEPLSAWEKMKELKKMYDNGEITYDEYNEKRKHLL